MIVSSAFSNLNEERIGRTPALMFHSRLLVEYSPVAGISYPMSGDAYVPVPCTVLLCTSETQITEAQWETLYKTGSTFPTTTAIQAQMTGNVTQYPMRVQLVQELEGRRINVLPPSTQIAPAAPQVPAGVIVGHCVLAIRSGEGDAIGMCIVLTRQELVDMGVQLDVDFRTIAPFSFSSIFLAQ